MSNPVLFHIHSTHIKPFFFTWDKIGRIKTGRTSDVTGVSSPIVILYRIVYLTATTTDTVNGLSHKHLESYSTHKTTLQHRNNTSSVV
jgi:hypothetical protein